MSKIVDKAGVWLVNQGQFRMPDPESGTIFEPGEPTKATLTRFVKDQPTIVRCADPSSDLTEKEQAKLAYQIEADEAERLKREKAAEVAIAAANNPVAAEAPTAAPAAPDIGVEGVAQDDPKAAA